MQQKILIHRRVMNYNLKQTKSCLQASVKSYVLHKKVNLKIRRVSDITYKETKR